MCSDVLFPRMGIEDKHFWNYLLGYWSQPLTHFMTSLGRSTWLVRLFFSLLPFCDFTTTATGTTRRQARRRPGSLAFVGLVGERVWICGWTVGGCVSTTICSPSSPRWWGPSLVQPCITCCSFSMLAQNFEIPTWADNSRYDLGWNLTKEISLVRRDHSSRLGYTMV